MDIQKFDPDNSLPSLLSKTTRALATRLQNSFFQAGFNVTSEQWMILLLLWKQDGRNPCQVAEIIGKDRAGVTRLIDGLEKRKLVTRVVDAVDRRQKKIRLTGAGKAMEKKLIPLGVDNTRRALQGLSSAEIEACKAILRKLHANMAG